MPWRVFTIIEWRYRKNNLSAIKAKSKIYRRNNLHRFSAITQKRRALKRKQFHPDHNLAIELQLHKLRNRVSNCLGVQFHVDHIYPIAKGGCHHHLNLQVISSSLNHRKYDNMDFKHPLLIHWSELPQSLLDWIVNNREENS